MAGSNISEEGMLNDTLITLQDNSRFSVSPAQGIMLIADWLQALQGDANLDQIKGQLDELRTALQTAQPNEHYIRELLISLADKTQEVAEDPNSEGTWTGGLESLSKFLRHFGRNS